MSKLEQFQDFIRSNGKELTGVNVPVVLSDESAKTTNVKFHFGWTIEIGVTKHEHGGYCPSGIQSGSSSQACDCAHNKAKEYVSGQNGFFNETFKKILTADVAKNFIIKDTNLGSAPDSYVGEDICHICNGRGKCSCSSCNGNGSTSCTSCSGSGRHHVTRQDHNNRTVYTTESCSSCYGSGTKTCYTCNGSGQVTCKTCDGGGYLYYSYTIDGDAKRSTKWFINSPDYHQWITDYVTNAGFNIINNISDVNEIDVTEALNGCTFIYGFTANLPTLQYTATIDNTDTTLCFAGTNNVTHNAGGVYDPAVWKNAKKLAAGDKDDDKKALAIPAIKNIIEAHETKTKIALLTENWVSKDIKEAVISNYQSLVSQLKKDNNQGFAWQLVKGVVNWGLILAMVAMCFAMLAPEMVYDAEYRSGLLSHYQFFIDLLLARFGLYGLPTWSNYPIVLAWFWGLYVAIPKLYWKQISQPKRLGLTVLSGYVVSYFLLNLVAILFTLSHYPLLPTNMLVGGGLLLSLYLVFAGFFGPKKWYFKILAGLAAVAGVAALQFGLETVSSQVQFIPEHYSKYSRYLGAALDPAIQYMPFIYIEIAVLAVATGIITTRRRFWIKAKTAVSEYDCAVLLKSLKLDK
ncbi:hypothetical protein BCU94_00015 [Shewanella sp. 10N.286.52.C2]|uniref:hypothetical protein n=1 Tax=Shewanella sp. 10N.286.52.C2 TaxID=1880838 RepID=UPI000C844D3B|nr:hypothetical protein [Shewanella sp. 10N.286.52.C2]PMG32156.1 hypothetical protein BCU94_00015 [Shewanella sp. 10N.286.52.C2]